MRIRSAECLLFVAIVASAGAMQLREHVAAAQAQGGLRPDLQPALQPDEQRLLPCAPPQAGLHSISCGETGVEAPQRAGTRRMQHTALWV
jgi:hypothetical protein